MIFLMLEDTVMWTSWHTLLWSVLSAYYVILTSPCHTPVSYDELASHTNTHGLSEQKFQDFRAVTMMTSRRHFWSGSISCCHRVLLLLVLDPESLVVYCTFDLAGSYLNLSYLSQNGLYLDQLLWEFDSYGRFRYTHQSNVSVSLCVYLYPSETYWCTYMFYLWIDMWYTRTYTVVPPCCYYDGTCA